MSSRWRGIGLVVILLLGVLLAWEPSRVAIQTAVLLPNLLDAGPKPLSLFSPAPRRASVAYWPVESSGEGSEQQEELAELWLPAWSSPDRRAGAMLLVFGVNNLGRNHPAIVRVAEGLARTGVAVLVPDSRTMLDGRLGGDEVDKIVAAFALLVSRPEVDPERAGIVGFSVGGSLALIAAADPAIDERVAWVNAFGAYADAHTYLASVASHAYIGTDGAAVAWQPTPLAREVFVNFMLDEVEPADRAPLRNAFEEPILAGERVAAVPDLRERLGRGGQAVHDLFTAASWQEARDAVDRLPEATRQFMASISPVNHVDGLRADAYLMHERDDHHVPYVESHHLAARLISHDRLHRYTQFRLFDHVQPDDLDLAAAAPELWKLLWHVHTLMVETL